MAAAGGDSVVGELEFQTHAVNGLKLDEIIDVEEKGSAKNDPVNESEPELVTTRWELWAWYAYYFGNNSAGTLSYAPLSI
jgi:hypothetical protein